MIYSKFKQNSTPVKVTSHFHSEYFKHVFDLGRESVILGLIDTHKYLFYIAIAARPVVRKRNVVHLTLLGEELKYVLNS